MTVATKNWIKHNILNVTAILALLGYVIVNAKSQERNDLHIEDSNLHMPFEQKVKIFVPRTEIKQMQDDISEIKLDVKELLKGSNK